MGKSDGIFLRLMVRELGKPLRPRKLGQLLTA